MNEQNGRLQSVGWLVGQMTCACTHWYSWRPPALGGIDKCRAHCASLLSNYGLPLS